MKCEPYGLWVVIGNGMKFASTFQFFPSPMPRWDCASGPPGALEKCQCVAWDAIYCAHCEAIRKRMRAPLLTDILSIFFFEEVSDSRRQDMA